MLATPDEKLRAVGLSRAKTLYLKDLAAHAGAGTIAVDQLHELDDAPLMEALTNVKGIGRWTAQMFMMFRLGRPDVLPDLDLGVRIAVQLAYNLRRMPTSPEVLARGAAWSPYSSYAAWYLWRSLELPEGVDARRKLVANAAATRSTGKKTTAKKTTAKKTTAKKTTAKAATANRTAAKKKTARTRMAKKRPATRGAARKAAKRGAPTR